MDQAAQIIALIYAAAAEETGWAETMLALQRAVGATNGGLFAAPDGVIETVHASSFDPADIRDYGQYYHRLDPWLQRLRGPVLEGGPATRAVVGQSLLTQDEFRRSEFYNNFARRIGLEWIVGAIGRLGSGSFHLGLHRPKGRESFGPAELAVVEAVVPHLRQGLQLRERLRGMEALPALMLDALPEAALVVDADLRLRHANLAAIRLCGQGSAIRLVQESRLPGAGLKLSMDGGTARLSALVQGAIRGTPGGAMRLGAEPGAEGPTLALLVSPLPAGLRPAGGPELTPGPAPGPAPGLALLMIRPLDRAAPPPALLQALFGFSLAEAEVAVGLAGGNGADRLAARRGVSPATIRAQVRALLEKTGTHNLRELEALLASLARSGPPCR